MGLTLHAIWFILVLVVVFVNYSSCSHPKLIAKTSNLDGFSPALATWYGDPNGAGSGGACGWADDVQSPPFSSMIAAGNANFYLKGKGCGTCYEVLCTREPYCSKKPITVTITDECPGACNKQSHALDLSGTAFGAMSSPGQADNLRNLGQVNIQYRRVKCNYGKTTIAFRTDAMANPYWFATAIEFCEGDGGVSSIEIAQDGSQHFRRMDNIWGAVWAADIDPFFCGPFTFRLVSRKNETIVASNAVPGGFEPGNTYYSQVNFTI